MACKRCKDKDDYIALITQTLAESEADRSNLKREIERLQCDRMAERAVEYDI